MLISPEILEDHGFNPKGVIHVGAHTGEEQYYYDQIGVKKTVWIEANYDLAKELMYKFIDRSDIRVICAVISDQWETLPFYITNNLASSSILELGTHETSHPKVFVTHEKYLQARPLKSLNLEGYDCLNLDIQGAELKALKGADLTGIKWIYTEVNTEEVYRNCAKLWEIDDYLTGFERIETNITRYGWGDALYKRK